MKIFGPEVVNAQARISKIPKGTRLSPEQVKSTEVQLERTKIARKEIAEHFERRGIDPQSERAKQLNSELETREIFLKLKLFLFDPKRRARRHEDLVRNLKAHEQGMRFIRKNEDPNNIEFNI